MKRPFNTRSLSAWGLMVTLNELTRITSKRQGRYWWSDGVEPDERARRLLLHWWAAGHDPRRALNRCGACDGRTVVWAESHGSWFSCPRCSGTGRQP